MAGEQERRPLPLTVEESFAKLEQLLDKLEDEDSSLEEAFSYYKRGIELVQSCSAQIDKVEKQMIILQDTWQEARTASFAGPDEDESEDEEDEGL
ncbi:MAG: exodeoxyribonuclease VII small subunit [Lachnospiraceae bacterium]|nr:exodeoxyribonuclease VII small subunit [Lachnospiraceae bacterium]